MIIEFANPEMLEGKGLLSDKDFGTFILKLNRVFKDFRIPRIRKFLDLQPMEYAEFLEIRDEYPTEIIPIQYSVVFSSSFFPELEQEVIDKLSILSPMSTSRVMFQSEAYGSDWQILPQEDYGSLVVAAHEIEKETLQRIRAMKFLDPNTHIEIVSSFSIKPCDVASSIHEVRIDILASFIF